MDNDIGPMGAVLKELNEVREQRDALQARFERLQMSMAETLASLKDARATATDAGFASGITHAINEIRRLTGGGTTGD